MPVSLHILFNIISLFFLGSFFLRLVGESDFLKVYFLGGLAGNILYVLLGPSTIPGVGASGAIFAIGGALAVMAPKLPVIVFPLPIPVPLWGAMVFFLLISFVIAGIAWQAHLGGFLLGMAPATTSIGAGDVRVLLADAGPSRWYNRVITSDGLQLVGGLHLPMAAGRLPALCICHGIPAVPFNPEDSGYHDLAARFADLGFVTLAFNMRGAGLSGGDFDMLGWSRDIGSAVAALSDSDFVDPARIFLLGFSGGAAAAIHRAAVDPRVAGVVSCASPADFRALVDEERLAGTSRTGAR